MSNPRMLLVLCVMGSLLAGSASSEGKTQAQTSKNEQALCDLEHIYWRYVWDLEHIYWRYVQDNNLSAYLSLWHKDFLEHRFLQHRDKLGNLFQQQNVLFSNRCFLRKLDSNSRIGSGIQ